MKDMLEDINGGILVDPFEPQQIADGILYLLNNPGERIAMGLRSRKKAVDYYSKQVINDTEAYYKSIL
jgi:glycosyltransferase involved in cell wall biosynthesis